MNPTPTIPLHPNPLPPRGKGRRSANFLPLEGRGLRWG